MIISNRMGKVKVDFQDDLILSKKEHTVLGPDNYNITINGLNNIVKVNGIKFKSKWYLTWLLLRMIWWGKSYAIKSA